jgi:peptide methionine sulfoxide reductase MsrA
MTEVKITKEMRYERLVEIVEAAGIEEEERAEMVEFIEKEIAALVNKREKAKERAAQKKTEGDELREVVYAVLTQELQTAEEILEKIDGEGVTKQKVVARLGQLVKAEKAHKEQVKVEGRKIMAYRLEVPELVEYRLD